MNFSMDFLWLVLKGIYVLAYGLYVSFAVVVVSQVGQMTKTVSGGFEKSARLIAWGHLFLAVLALIWAIVVI